MIHDVFVIHRDTEIPLYHNAPGNKSKLASMGLDTNLFAQLATTIVRVLRRAGALDRLILAEAKVAFLVYENIIFALITSHDHDEFEINYALDKLSSLFLKSFATDVINEFKQKPLSFDVLNIDTIFRSTRVLVSDTDSLLKSMIQRLVDMISVAGRLEADASMLAEKQSLDGTVVLSINAMQKELEAKLKKLKEKMDQLPVMPGSE